MGAHIQVSDVTCDPSTVETGSPQDVTAQIHYTNTGDEPATEITLVVFVLDPDGNAIMNQSNPGPTPLDPGSSDSVVIQFPAGTLTQEGTYTVNIGVEGGDSSQGGSCQITVRGGISL